MALDRVFADGDLIIIAMDVPNYESQKFSSSAKETCPDDRLLWTLGIGGYPPALFS